MEVALSIAIVGDMALKYIILSDDDETSDEDEIVSVVLLTKKRRRKPSRIENYVERTVPNLTAREFQQHFRITIDAYEHLIQMVGPLLKRKNYKGRFTINVEKQLLAVIWLLATPDSYRSVGERFDLGKSSLSVCFMRVIKILCSLTQRIITWPTGHKLTEVKEKFRQMAGLPNVIGAIDGTYICIKAPHEDPESYITRKSHYAITLQAICDANLKFTDVFVGYPGSVHDNRIFRNFEIYIAVRNHLQQYFPDDEYIIGDKAYPCLSWCIPPYINRGNLTPAKRHFNTIMAKTRQTIERSFALLMGRFRRLKFLDMQRTDLIPTAVLASCVLHNICLEHRDVEIDNYIREGIDDIYHNDENEGHGHQEIEGTRKRDELCRQLFI
ncbi:hypothetical protein Zmor_014976 [Zophobas morio]|uniref:Putative nuclease HARBI1 n=1 Tax=Zophobas morio TaxID=2755281 RepID=A0AA38MGQ8_9CUCU|nr:hypothetical protein Zmor_014976 [Zophobas morio]